MTEKGLLIVISGPSGTGKGTICRALLQQQPDIFLSVSATTRSPRDGEIDGVHYHFMSKGQFEQMLEQEEFLEWASVYDNYYGTPKSPVTGAIAAGKDVLLEIDMQGALKVKEKAPDGTYIFIVPPSLKALRQRITGRGKDSVAEIDKRMNKARHELTYLQDYDFVVINDKLDQAVAKVQCIMAAEKCRTDRYRIQEESGYDQPLLAAK